MMMINGNQAYSVVMALVLASATLTVGAEQLPEIISVSPNVAGHGTQVIIRGSGFNVQSNDISFDKVGNDDDDDQRHIGYVTGIPSNDGKTLIFALPASVGVCPFSTMEPDTPCIEIALILDEGEYDIFVINEDGRSNSVRFTITSDEALVQKIETEKGELTLSYEDGIATLTGILQRSTPCVDWGVTVTTTRDLPPSHVEFSIVDKNKGVICIQVLGEPQQISATSRAGEDTSYKIIVEANIVFSGMLSDDGKKDAALYMKIKKQLVLLSLWNYGDDPVHGVEIAADNAVQSVKTRIWTNEQLDDNTFLLQSSDKSLSKNENLIILLRMDDPHSGIAWTAFDEDKNVLASGGVMP